MSSKSDRYPLTDREIGMRWGPHCDRIWQSKMVSPDLARIIQQGDRARMGRELYLIRDRK